MYPTSLRALIRKFLMLEIGAAALYRMHGRLLPPALRPLFKEFESIEIDHREQFARLYRTLNKGRNWWAMPFVKIGASLLACAVSLGGTRFILTFERNIERKAVADYTDALETVKDAAVRTAIHHVLADEVRHDELLSLLREYRGDEEHHIAELEKALHDIG
jgi:rubrerythrin